MKGKTIAIILIALLFGTLSGCVDKPKTETQPGPTPVQTPTPAKQAPVYEGTLYVAGAGGHFSEAKVEIDPSKAEPIKIISLDRIKLNNDINISKKIYATHDPRIDLKTNTLYWSAIVNDSGDVHVGKLDLGTGKVTADVKINRDASFKSGPMYCGSGQSAKEFLPVFMGYPGYVDVIDKATMEHKKRVYLDSPEIPKNYTFAHGINSPDNKYFVLWLNGAKAAGKSPREDPNLYIYKLDMETLLKGELKITQKATLTGHPNNTNLFRGYFTDEGKYLFISGGDRGYILDAATLKEVDVEILPAGWDNHDIKPTADGKYALFTVRVPVEVQTTNGTKKFTDGQIQLYDFGKKELVGKPISVCEKCHDKQGTGAVRAIHCGIDAVWKN